MVGRDTIYCPVGFCDEVDELGELVEGDWRSEQQEHAGSLRSVQATHARNFTQEANNVRNRFTNYFKSVQGSVEWQWSTPGLQGLLL